MESHEKGGDGPKPKDSKKDRHMKLLSDLAKFLERANETAVQEVLLLKRTIRETLETFDEDLEKYCAAIDEPAYLIDKSEDEVNGMLTKLKARLSERARMIDKLTVDLDQTELKRVEVVGSELKRLVDVLVSIGYQLPEDIERMVANEAFEVNQEVIANRVAHAKAVGEWKVSHIKLDAQLIKRWEGTRAKWRQIRHEKALQDYRADIRSPHYNDPEDRKRYMAKFRDGQKSRREEIKTHIGVLLAQNYGTIVSSTIVDLQQSFSQCNENEAAAIQVCYNRLTDLRAGTDALAKERMEAIRKELHLYGALKVDPKLPLYANRLEPALEEESLAELWRLGGGLKPDIQTLISELRCEDVVYDRVVQSMREKIQLIQASFPLKAVLEEKGRLSQLDKIRSLVGKLRSAPRAEIAAVLKALLPELEDVSRMEPLAGIFATSLAEIAAEANAELSSYESKLQALSALSGTMSLPPSSASGPGSTATTHTAAATKSLEGTSLGKTVGLAGTTSKTAKTATLAGTKGKKADKEGPSVYIDPMLLKGWHRKLGILFYGTDLPQDYQNLLAEIFQQVGVQGECNVLVDAVVVAESDELLRRMDRRYKKLIDRIITYMEAQATLVSVQTSNLCAFYICLAKIIEAHRGDQKRLDDKSTEELWDVKEDYRIQLEDCEAEYQAACQRIREATKEADVRRHFEEVIVALDKIQQNYREYHKHACFSADKYSLWLIDEFRSCLVQLCSLLFMQAHPDHPVLTEYDRIFDTVVRLNSAFFEENPHAGGVERTANAELDASLVAEDYVSPYGKVDPEAVLAYAGQYALFSALPAICSKFSIDSFFTVAKDKEAAEGGEEGSGGAAETSEALRALTISKPVPHGDCPWMKSTATVLPVDSDVLEAMDAEDREDYEAQLAKHFYALTDDLPPVDAAPVAVPPKGKKGAPPPNPATMAPATTVITPGVFPTLSQLSLEDREKYAKHKELTDKIKQRLEQQTSAEYVLQNVPRDEGNQPWVAQVEITEEEITQLYKNIRHNVISSFETEAFKKIVSTERRMSTMKGELTDELEDRIRNHWPRRGRVETEIKQPREKELLGHKDKTYRLILSIQEKMVDLQSKYTSFLQESRSACDTYVNEMTALRNSLSGNFKNLASLQGLDVKARSTTLDFQADSESRIHKLRKLSTVDVEAIVAYARDFRKICPLQKPGVEGGYSEAELQEIHVLMEAQCADMAVVRDEWSQQISQLSEQQTQSLLCQEEFNAKYAKCTQEVAMAEGLGQKYGAPRRRAQERIRTDVSRDERAAGKVDELLALIEFVCSEMAAQHASKAAEKESKASTSSPSPNSKTKTSPQEDLANSLSDAPSATAARGVENITRLQYLWKLVMTVRAALIQRVKYLDVLGDKSFADLANSTLPWMDTARLHAAARKIFREDAAALDLSPTVPSLEEPNIPGQAALMSTIHASFEDICAVCRKETKQLYESEGKGPMIPASLEQWLSEARDKMLGRHGYQERAWKRLWAQAARLDQLLNRNKTNEEDGVEEPGLSEERKEEVGNDRNKSSLGSSNQHSLAHPPPPHHDQLPPPAGTQSLSLVPRVFVQGTCLLSLCQSHMALSKKQWKTQAQSFAELLAVWELGRDKHERLLKPRLGSPDKADELTALDKIEMDRSQEMQRGVIALRCLLIRNQMERFRVFCEDLGQAGKALVLMLDSCLRQELVVIPPDTAVPKKHMTLKKLRKAQRIREDVAKGKDDTSQRRIWGGIELSPETIASITSAEDLVPDLGSFPEDTTGVKAESADSAATAGSAAAAPNPKEGKDKKAPPAKEKKPDKNAPPPVAVKPSLLPSSWLERLKEASTVQGLVSSAHRTVLQYRDEAFAVYLKYLQAFLVSVREEYGLILQQEESWTQRWQRQVSMLRDGKI